MIDVIFGFRNLFDFKINVEKFSRSLEKKVKLYLFIIRTSRVLFNFLSIEYRDFAEIFFDRFWNAHSSATLGAENFLQVTLFH